MSQYYPMPLRSAASYEYSAQQQPIAMSRSYQNTCRADQSFNHWQNHRGHINSVPMINQRSRGYRPGYNPGRQKRDYQSDDDYKMQSVHQQPIHSGWQKTYLHQDSGYQNSYQSGPSYQSAAVEDKALGVQSMLKSDDFWTRFGEELKKNLQKNLEKSLQKSLGTSKNRQNAYTPPSNQKEIPPRAVETEDADEVEEFPNCSVPSHDTSTSVTLPDTIDEGKSCCHDALVRSEETNSIEDDTFYDCASTSASSDITGAEINEGSDLDVEACCSDSPPLMSSDSIDIAAERVCDD